MNWALAPEVKMKKHLQIVLLLAIASASSLSAQTSSTVPVPSHFASAHNIFLASAGATPLGSNEQLYSSLLYASTYKMLQGIGKYQLVSTPAESDIAFQVSAIQQAGMSDCILRLEARDTKTNSLLWDIDTTVGSWSTGKDAETVIDQGTQRFADQLRSLIAGTLPTPKKK